MSIVSWKRLPVSPTHQRHSFGIVARSFSDGVDATLLKAFQCSDVHVKDAQGCDVSLGTDSDYLASQS